MECLLCFEKLDNDNGNDDNVKCFQCDKVWCKVCNERWIYQQKYGMMVKSTCPFCRANLTTSTEPWSRENDRENGIESDGDYVESNRSFFESMVKWMLSIFCLGILLALPAIEVITSNNEVAFTSFVIVVWLFVVLCLEVLVCGYVRHYLQVRNDDEYVLEEDAV